MRFADCAPCWQVMKRSRITRRSRSISESRQCLCSQQTTAGGLTVSRMVEENLLNLGNNPQQIGHPTLRPKCIQKSRPVPCRRRRTNWSREQSEQTGSLFVGLILKSIPKKKQNSLNSIQAMQV